MSTAKRLVLSLRGRKESQSTAGTASSTRLVSGTNSCSSPGHELDEIAVVSGIADSSHALYGSMSQANGPRYVTGTPTHLNDAIENDLPFSSSGSHHYQHQQQIPLTSIAASSSASVASDYPFYAHQQHRLSLNGIADASTTKLLHPHQHQPTHPSQSSPQQQQHFYHPLQQQHQQQQPQQQQAYAYHHQQHPQQYQSFYHPPRSQAASGDGSSLTVSQQSLLRHVPSADGGGGGGSTAGFSDGIVNPIAGGGGLVGGGGCSGGGGGVAAGVFALYGGGSDHFNNSSSHASEQQLFVSTPNPQTPSRRSEHRGSACRSNLMDIVGSKFGMQRPQLGQSISQQGFFSSSRDSISPPCGSGGGGGGGTGGGASGIGSVSGIGLAPGSVMVGGDGTGHRTSHAHVSATTSEMDLTHNKNRHKERSRMKGGEQPLLGSWNRTGDGRGSTANTLGTNASSNHLSSGCNGTDRFARRSGCSTTSRLRAHTKWTFVFDPAGRLCYYWSMVVSLAFLYNFWVIIYRFSFQEINAQSILVWFCLDYFADFLYLVDILFHFRTGYLEDGVLQTVSAKLRVHYMNSTTFYIDCLCLLPLDFLYLSIGFNSILRSFRLVKIYRFWAFMDRTERHTNYPNVFRSTSLIHYLLVVFHWNGCLYHLIYKNNGFGSRTWVYHDAESDDVVKQYLQSFYWCTLALTTIGDLPRPRSKAEYVFVIVQMLFGLMLFATVLGHVSNIVTSVSAARKEFQAKLDGVKTYMRMRRVPNQLQVKVIKWFDYLWLTQKCSDEEKAVSCLPDKLKAEIAINVHLDTLKRVEIFQNTEAGFLCELVLRLRPVLFSPGDYICRKGEVGKEMYIVNRGRLQVVADNGKTVMASLKAGSYFGEISILNMGTAGNRRTASVRSVGYSDLFVLSKKDMWDVLKEYPAARVRLEAIAVKRLQKYKKAPLAKVAMGRCQSTPGLVETKGRTPIDEMWMCQSTHTALTYYNQSSLFSRAPSPRASVVRDEQVCRERKKSVAMTETPGSLSPSSDERPRSRNTSHCMSMSRPQSQHSRAGHHICDSLTQLSGAAVPLLGSHEALEDEIKRLRERLHTVEAENSALNSKLSQQQWVLENRLAEIEMQLCGASSASSIDQDNEAEDAVERNRESII